jgi:hypothetical protein
MNQTRTIILTAVIVAVAMSAVIGAYYSSIPKMEQFNNEIKASKNAKTLAEELQHIHNAYESLKVK